jgi:hypothetical protein
MGIIIGDTFEDFGNTIEYTVGEVRAYEMLSGDRVRLYVTEERGPAHVLQYTIVAPLCSFAEFGRKCFEIAGKKHVLPDWALEKKNHASAH